MGETAEEAFLRRAARESVRAANRAAWAALRRERERDGIIRKVRDRLDVEGGNTMPERVLRKREFLFSDAEEFARELGCSVSDLERIEAMPFDPMLVRYVRALGFVLRISVK